MNRRNFIRLSTAGLIPFLACQPDRMQKKYKALDIHIQSDMVIGHLLFQPNSYRLDKNIETETLIIGGGIAGISTAYLLRAKDCIVCELSDTLGGSSSAHQYKDAVFSQGAHYDLVYPKGFGEEVLGLFEELGIIRFNRLKDSWDFSEQQFMIPAKIESQCQINGKLRGDVLLEGSTTKAMIRLMEQFYSKIQLPLRLIDKKYHYLNNLSFFDFLNKQIDLSIELIEAIDYQMTDDFSGTSRKVSALAGVYYYGNRPYFSGGDEVFSPPEGNYYFIRKMSDKVPKEKFLLNHLVKRIESNKADFLVDVIDIQNRSLKRIRAKKIIYAGQKHTLKYIYPKDYPLFKKNEYAPWLVMNFIVKDIFVKKSYWQNEIISGDKHFLGFIDSTAQARVYQGYQVFTVYYCFPTDYRKELADENKLEKIAEYTLEEIAWYLELDRKKLFEATEKVFVKVLGHAMPIPKPFYLLNDKNHYHSEKNLVYAGVDNSRLPLLFEAVDSAVVAVKSLGFI